MRKHQNRTKSDAGLREDSIGAPLRDSTFRRIWTASLFSNLGSLIQGVGVAWAMTEMTSSADKVAQVQTALNLPVVLIALLAGAVADVHDRRIVALASLGIAFVGSISLAILALLGLLTPNLLLLLCFAVGCGTALMGPAWQTAVSEQVSLPLLPAAVALNGLSYNIARSVGPAIGGVVVATAGVVAAFTVNALCYVPLIVALYLWNRTKLRPRIPPEDLTRAMVSGLRYVTHAPPIKVVLLRSLAFGTFGGVILALMPLVASSLLHGGAGIYGLIFSAFGIGAVIGAFLTPYVRRQLSSEQAIRICAITMGAAMILIGVSRSALLTSIALLFGGASWTLAWTIFNVGVQLSVPRWVVGRSLAAYQAASMGGIAIGSWASGHIADVSGVSVALLLAGASMIASILLGIWLRMPATRTEVEAISPMEDPDLLLAVDGRDGPLIVVVEYRVDVSDAPAFRKLMDDIQLARQRNGAYGWSLSRDIIDQELWTERYHCPTWHDYLRHRDRPTQSERDLQQRALDFHGGSEPVRVKRMLESPFDPTR